MNAAFPDLGCKQRTKAVPPVPYGLMANVDAALGQKIFDLSQRQAGNGHTVITALRMTSGELLK